MRIGSAPVSFGIHGGVDVSRLAATPRQLLEAIAGAGYRGSELGPPGFFGTPQETVAMFADTGLEVIGAYVPLHLSQPEAVMAHDLDSMKRTLEELAATGNSEVLAVLADEGDDAILSQPFRPAGARGLSSEQWKLAIDRLNRANDIAVEAGVSTTFHPHFGTYVEQASEIDTLLELSSIKLCLDTGHFVLGGADPADYFEKWSHRVNHIHVKDVHLDVLRQAEAQGKDDIDSWWSDVSCPLGEGDAPLDRFMANVASSGYQGWLVVEQDGDPATESTWERIVADQAANQSWVARKLRF